MTDLFYDCEFLEDGRTIELISIGMVTEDGREYYAVNADADWEAIARHDWLCENVIPSLPLAKCGTLPDLVTRARRGKPVSWYFNVDDSSSLVRPKRLIANEVRDFILSVPDPSLWVNWGSYDHVVLSQLWGRMIDHPEGVPIFTNELQQEWERLGKPELPRQADGEHNALADARHNKVIAEFLAGLRA
jgi:hypothetical protein